MLQETSKPAWLDAFEAVLCALRACSRATPWPCSRKARAARCWSQLARLAAARMGCRVLLASTCPRRFEHRARRCAPPAHRTALQQHRAGGRGPRRQHVGRRLHGRRPDARARAAGHPEGRRARALREQRTSGSAGAPACPAMALRAAGEGPRQAPARGASSMHVTSAAGTDLAISLEGAACGGNWGYTARPGTMTHWPGGLALAFPGRRQRQRHAGARAGRRQPHVQALHRTAVTLRIEDDYVTPHRRRAASTPS